MQGGHPTLRTLRKTNQALLESLPNAAELLRLLDQQPPPHPSSSSSRSSSSSAGARTGSAGSDEDDREQESSYQSKGSLTGPRAPVLSKGVAVAGSQFRLPAKLMGCDQCTSLDVRLKKSKETVRGLRLQLARAEETIAELRRAQRSGEQQGDAGSLGLADRVHVLLQRCNEAEAEVARLKKLRASDQASLEGLRVAATASAAELSHHRGASAALREEAAQQAACIRDLERQLGDARMEALQHSTALGQCEARLAATASREMAAGGRSAQDAAELGRLQQALRAAQEDQHRLATDGRALEAALSASEAARARAALEQAQLEASGRQAREALEMQAASLDARAGQLEASLADRESSLGASQRALKTLTAGAAEQQQQIEALRLQLDLAAAEGRERDARQQQQQQALQRAMSSSVRLCIVAPSVNVHVADQKMRFSAALDEGALGAFLRAEVLGKYSLLFKQKEGDGEEAEGWVDALLGDMQRSIEAHVAQAVESGDKGNKG